MLTFFLDNNTWLLTLVFIGFFFGSAIDAYIKSRTVFLDDESLWMRYVLLQRLKSKRRING